MPNDALRAEIGRRLMLAHAAEADARRRRLAVEYGFNRKDDSMERSLSNVDMASAVASTPDIQTAGNPGRWVLICKASSKGQGWMKSTKAMEVPGGCLVQVTTEHRNFAGDEVVACAEAVTFVPGVTVKDLQ